MRFWSLAAIAAVVLVHTANADCDYTRLVECFVRALDDFTNVIWVSRKNIVTLSDDDCVHVRKMGDCIDDTLGHGMK